MQSIYDFVKQQPDNYRSQTIEITDGYEFSQYQKQYDITITKKGQKLDTEYPRDRLNG